MVVITNGVDKFKVTEGAYYGIYKHQGYTMVQEQQAPGMIDYYAGPAVAMSADDAFVAEVVRKPIMSWSKDEVKRFAVAKGIDLAGTKNANEAKEIIKRYINQ